MTLNWTIVKAVALLVALTARLLHWNDGIAAHREGNA